MANKISLKEAIKFHGHLGPYLVLGLLCGDSAIKKLKANKYFGINVKVWGANKKPQSCLIDGLQLSTGATYGKGNISKFNAKKIKIEVLNNSNGKKAAFKFKPAIIQRLKRTKTHRDSEILAKKLFKEGPRNIFDLLPVT
ncbi:MAG: formylmethanofuran dehydrogenase subunit E family protein [Candidatus Omnitrophota bacterium]|jgi:formylmethanofuran dehydrogenase subunit E